MRLTMKTGPFTGHVFPDLTAVMAAQDALRRTCEHWGERVIETGRTPRGRFRRERCSLCQAVLVNESPVKETCQ